MKLIMCINCNKTTAIGAKKPKDKVVRCMFLMSEQKMMGLLVMRCLVKLA